MLGRASMLRQPAVLLKPRARTRTSFHPRELCVRRFCTQAEKPEQHIEQDVDQGDNEWIDRFEKSTGFDGGSSVNWSKDDLPTTALKTLLGFGIDGLGPLSGSREIADEYQVGAAQLKVDSLIRAEVSKGFAAGFVGGALGMLALPAVPLSVKQAWILQSRLSGAIAHLYGHDLADDKVRTAVLLCLLGENNGLSTDLTDSHLTGNQISSKFAREFLYARVPLSVVYSIQRSMGRQLALRMGTRGVAHSSARMLPILGGVVSGSIDSASMLMVANTSVKVFEDGPAACEEEPPSPHVT